MDRPVPGPVDRYLAKGYKICYVTVAGAEGRQATATRPPAAAPFHGAPAYWQARDRYGRSGRSCGAAALLRVGARRRAVVHVRGPRGVLQGVQASSDYYPSHYPSYYIGRYPTRYPGRYPGRYPSRPVADHVVEIRSRSRDYAESIRNVHTLCARRTLSESSESLFESLSVRKVRAFYARRARCARAFVGG